MLRSSTRPFLNRRSKLKPVNKSRLLGTTVDRIKYLQAYMKLKRTHVRSELRTLKKDVNIGALRVKKGLCLAYSV
jgi:hypothetical protein